MINSTATLVPVIREPAPSAVRKVVGELVRRFPAAHVEAKPHVSVDAGHHIDGWRVEATYDYLVVGSEWVPC